jgi:hypothetical protein
MTLKQMVSKAKKFYRENETEITIITLTAALGASLALNLRYEKKLTKRNARNKDYRDFAYWVSRHLDSGDAKQIWAEGPTIYITDLAPIE